MCLLGFPSDVDMGVVNVVIYGYYTLSYNWSGWHKLINDDSNQYQPS